MKEADTLGWNCVNVVDIVPTLIFDVAHYDKIVVKYNDTNYILDIEKFIKLCCYKENSSDE